MLRIINKYKSYSNYLFIYFFSHFIISLFIDIIITTPSLKFIVYSIVYSSFSLIGIYIGCWGLSIFVISIIEWPYKKLGKWMSLVILIIVVCFTLYILSTPSLLLVEKRIDIKMAKHFFGSPFLIWIMYIWEVEIKHKTDKK